MEKTHITLKEGGNGGSPRYMAWGSPAESGLNMVPCQTPIECQTPKSARFQFKKVFIKVIQSGRDSLTPMESVADSLCISGSDSEELRPECYDCKGQITEKVTRQKSLGSKVVVSPHYT